MMNLVFKDAEWILKIREQIQPYLVLALLSYKKKTCPTIDIAVPDGYNVLAESSAKECAIE